MFFLRYMERWCVYNILAKYCDVWSYSHAKIDFCFGHVMSDYIEMQYDQS